MALALDKSLRQLAAQIVREHGEPLDAVCRALLNDVIAGQIVTMPALTQAKRQWLADNGIVEKIGTERRRWGPSNNPSTPAFWLRKLHASDAAITGWLAVKGAAPVLVERSDPRQNPKPSVPNRALTDYFQKMKAKGGPAPAADEALHKQAQAHFHEYQVTRQDVRTVHRNVWGRQRPGPRTRG